MSDLQLSLIVIGAAAVGAVFAYNKWQESKHRKLSERIFRTEHADVLLGGQDGMADPGDRIEPVLREGGEEPEAEQPAAPEEPPRDLVDPAIDCMVRLESAEPIGGGLLWQAQNQALDKLSKPAFWAGLNERTGVWERLTASSGGDYRRLCAALQLADRRGPLPDAELTLFFNGMQHLADEFLAVTDIPPRSEVLARAAEIDRFCAGVDIQIGINVVAMGGAFAGTKLRGLAEAAGLVLREDGMFHAEDDQGRTLYMLANLEPALFAADDLKVLTTRGITFTLDVPRVADGTAAFGRMVALARQMAESLDGVVVDDNHAPLADTALEVIHAKISEIGQRMAGYGIAAGGLPALRLFS